MRPTIPLLLVLLLALPAAPAALAQDDPTRQALARAQFLVRQLNAEKARLQRDLAELKQQIGSLEKQVAGLEKELDETERGAEATEGRLRGALDEWRAGYQDLRDKHLALGVELREAQGENERLTASLAERDGQLASCVAANEKLAEVGFDILTRYRDAGFRGADPFTGLKRVEIENIVQDYRFDLEDHRVGPARLQARPMVAE